MSDGKKFEIKFGPNSIYFGNELGFPNAMLCESALMYMRNKNQAQCISLAEVYKKLGILIDISKVWTYQHVALTDKFSYDIIEVEKDGTVKIEISGFELVADIVN